MFQIKNTETEEIANVYDVYVVQEAMDGCYIEAIIYGSKGWQVIELDDTWVPTNNPYITDVANNKKPKHQVPFDISFNQEPAVRGFIDPNGSLSI